jgi:hypothetical protein
MRSSGEIQGVGSSRGSPTTPITADLGAIPNGTTGVIGNVERAPTPRLRERPKEVEKEQPPDYSHAPPATPRKEATVKVVVMGDANADWLAYGLEDAFSEKPEIGIVRKHRCVCRKSDSAILMMKTTEDRP